MKTLIAIIASILSLCLASSAMTMEEYRANYERERRAAYANRYRNIDVIRTEQETEKIRRDISRLQFEQRQAAIQAARAEIERQQMEMARWTAEANRRNAYRTRP